MREIRDRTGTMASKSPNTWFPRHLVEPTNSNSMSDRAPRPNDVSLDNSKAKQVLATPMLSLSEGLGLILESAEK
jgi:dTDP-4-dehydrorhamnose reductase